MSSAGLAALASVLLASSPARDGKAANDHFIRGAGPVHVMYAGSLTRFFEKNFGPAFQAATGFTFQGGGRGSAARANLTKGKAKAPDRLISAYAKVDQSLNGDANGNYACW